MFALACCISSILQSVPRHFRSTLVLSPGNFVASRYSSSTSNMYQTSDETTCARARHAVSFKTLTRRAGCRIAQIATPNHLLTLPALNQHFANRLVQ